MESFNPSHRVRACVDGAPGTDSVCDHAVWAAQQLGVALELLHVLDALPEIAPQVDLSGAIGADAREALLSELHELDARRNRLVAQQGELMLQALQSRVQARGQALVETRQMHAGLVEAVMDLEADTRLFVLGQHHHLDADAMTSRRLHLDHQVERVIRAVHKPVLVVACGFQVPRRAVIGFDGSATARRAVERVAASPLLQGVGLTLAMARENGAASADLAWARQHLAEAGHTADTEVLAGEPETALLQAVRDSGADLLVIGAYGHSRIRHLIVGSTTTTLLRTCPVPVLVLR